MEVLEINIFFFLKAQSSCTNVKNKNLKQSSASVLWLETDSAQLCLKTDCRLGLKRIFECLLDAKM